MITYFDIHSPIARPLPQTRRRPPNQPRRPTSRRDKKNGAVDMRRLDGVLQDLGFAPKPHPTIFSENEPDALFDGLEKFQTASGLTVDGAVKNKDSETGRALNKAMEEYYNPSARRKAGAQRPEVILTGTDPGRPTPPPEPEPDEELEKEIAEKRAECAALQADADEAERNMDLNSGTAEGKRWKRIWTDLIKRVPVCRGELGTLLEQRPGYMPEKRPPPKFPKPTVPNKKPGTEKKPGPEKKPGIPI